jgi:hypothetical protein
MGTGCVIPDMRKSLAGKHVSMTKSTLSKLDRGIAVGLAVIFIAAGITGIIMGIARYHWLLVLIGLVSVWWGSVWTRVAAKGRRLQFLETLWPFLRR